MEEEFPAAGICGKNWWMDASRTAFVGGGGGPSRWSMGHDLGAYGSYNWSSCKDYLWNSNSSHNSNIISTIEGGSSDSPGDQYSMVFQSSQGHPQQQQQADSDDHSGGAGGVGGSKSMLMDSTLQMMGFNLSSSSSSSSPDWNQTLIGNSSSTGRGEDYAAILQEDMNLGLNPSTEIQKNWISTLSDHSRNSTITTGPGRLGGGGGGRQDDDPSLHIGPFKPVSNHENHYSLEEQICIDNNPTATCQGLSSSGFHMGPSTYGYPSSLIQTLFESDPISPPPQQQQSMLISNRSSMNFYESGHLDHEPSSCWPNTNKIPSPLGTRRQQASSSGMHFSNNTPYWNASASSSSFDENINSAGNFMSSSQPQFVAVPALQEKPNCSNLTAKTRKEEARNSRPVAKKGSEPAFKRPRIETPSPLPTFKVRKEKLGDRITALQQLVSPFGKTDTASVLHEAIEYIKYLHDQVNVLSTPYMKNANPIQHQSQQGVNRLKDPEGTKQDLRSRGLCLVPILSTIPVASETTSDFWTPTFGGAFR